MKIPNCLSLKEIFCCKIKNFLTSKASFSRAKMINNIPVSVKGPMRDGAETGCKKKSATLDFLCV